MPKVFLKSIALVLLIVSAPAYAKRVQREVVKITSGKQWRVNDSVCFHREDKIIACGRVIGNSSYLVSIKSPSLHDRVSAGDTLYVFGEGPGRQPSSYGDKYVVKRTVPLFHRSLTFGAFGGQGFIMPALNFQLSLGGGISLGIMPTFSRNSESNSVLGSFGTLDFYFSGNTFSGLNLSIAAGVYNFQDTTQVAKFTPAVQGTLGYRFLARGGFNLGIGVGAQYVQSQNVFLIGTRTTVYQPLGKVDLGISF